MILGNIGAGKFSVPTVPGNPYLILRNRYNDFYNLNTSKFDVILTSAQSFYGDSAKVWANYVVIAKTDNISCINNDYTSNDTIVALLGE